MVCPRFSLLVLNGAVWHRSGANRTSKSRRAVLAAYLAPLVRPMIDPWRESVDEDTKRTASRRVRTLLGAHFAEFDAAVSAKRRRHEEQGQIDGTKLSADLAVPGAKRGRPS